MTSYHVTKSLILPFQWTFSSVFNALDHLIPTMSREKEFDLCFLTEKDKVETCKIQENGDPVALPTTQGISWTYNCAVCPSRRSVL